MNISVLLYTVKNDLFIAYIFLIYIITTSKLNKEKVYKMDIKEVMMRSPASNKYGVNITFGNGVELYIPAPDYESAKELCIIVLDFTYADVLEYLKVVR